MKKIMNIITTIIILKTNIYCGWWIFGSSKDDVIINYLYISGIPYEEMKEKTTIYREFLENNEIIIRGKASIKKKKIASVKISIDNKQNWNEAKLSQDGAFEFSFKPEENKTYTIFIEAMDPSGKTNKVDETKRIIMLSNESLSEKLNKTLEKIFNSYSQKNLKEFMRYVCESFTPDYVSLERDIINDFKNFQTITINYFIKKMFVSKKGEIYSNITFSRTLIPSKNPKALSDSGTTELFFKLEGDELKLYKMSFPIIFGVSNPQDIYSSVFRTPENTKTIVIDSTGEANVINFDDAAKGVESGADVEIDFEIIGFFYGGSVIPHGLEVKWKNIPGVVEYKIYEKINNSDWKEPQGYFEIQKKSPTNIIFSTSDFVNFNIQGKFCYYIKLTLESGKTIQSSTDCIDKVLPWT